jgi:hypothetical protein
MDRLAAAVGALLLLSCAAAGKLCRQPVMHAACAAVAFA